MTVSPSRFVVGAASLLVLAAALAAACGGSVVTDPSTASSSSSGSSGASSSSGALEGPCTTIGCRNGFIVALAAPSGWKHGEYVFTLTADGVERTCKGALPLPTCGTRGLVCSGGVTGGIVESGCALPPSAHSFPELGFDTLPSKVTIQVERDGITLADESFAPNYVTRQPNGPSCEPTCQQASASITLKEP